MKLKIKKIKLSMKDKEEQYIEVKFWSFLRCTILVQMAMAGIIYGAIFIVLMFMAFIGMCSMLPI